MDLFKKVQQAIVDNHLLKAGDHVLIGVSGGPDSMALMHILKGLRYELGIQISVAHLNHNLRKNSARDENFVRTRASRLNLKFSSGSIRIKKSPGRSSLEEAARQARFDFLIHTAKKLKANTVALAHTRDELAETVLMRILRGSGLEGLRSILPKREIRGMTFIRPFLSIEKKELLAFLKKNRIPFLLDSTNKNTDFFRNKIRLKLLPLLEKDYQPNIREVLSNLADVSALDYDFIAETGKGLLKKTLKASSNPKITYLNTEILKRQHPALERFLIRETLAILKKSPYNFSLHHTQQVQNLSNKKAGSQLLLPNGILLTKKTGCLKFVA